jgi:hypothetical protein
MKILSWLAVIFTVTSSFAAESLDITKVTVAKNITLVGVDKKVQEGDVLTVGTLVSGTDASSVLQIQWHEQGFIRR